MCHELCPLRLALGLKKFFEKLKNGTEYIKKFEISFFFKLSEIHLSELRSWPRNPFSSAIRVAPLNQNYGSCNFFKDAALFFRFSL